jgi:competence protein ComEA
VARPASIVIVLALAGLSAVVAFRAGERVRPTEISPVVAHDDAPGGSITVHVSGAVAHPGLVELPAGARMADAVAAAGGASTDADLAGVNLAEPLSDGTRVIVPGPGIGVAGSGGDGRIRLATASAEELTTLPGIGPVLAERIVAHREEVGAFDTVDDLLDVSGIGERLLAGLRDLVEP